MVDTLVRDQQPTDPALAAMSSRARIPGAMDSALIVMAAVTAVAAAYVAVW